MDEKIKDQISITSFHSRKHSPSKKSQSDYKSRDE